jgi:hypothetical protein
MKYLDYARIPVLRRPRDDRPGRSRKNPALGPMTDTVTQTSVCINTESVGQLF